MAVYTLFQGGAVWQLQATPAYTWLGGVIGALFVATSSWALARLGAMACALLVISGQMLTGVWLDSLSRELGWQAWLGAALILAGVILQAPGGQGANPSSRQRVGRRRRQGVKFATCVLHNAMFSGYGFLV